VKQLAEVGLDRVWRQTQRDALAGAATVQRQHQAWPFLRAAKALVPAEAERAVPTMGNGETLFDDGAGRLPDE
jgi:hypothetical protein